MVTCKIAFFHIWNCGMAWIWTQEGECTAQFRCHTKCTHARNARTHTHTQFTVRQPCNMNFRGLIGRRRNRVKRAKFFTKCSWSAWPLEKTVFAMPLLLASCEKEVVKFNADRPVFRFQTRAWCWQGAGWWTPPPTWSPATTWRRGKEQCKSWKRNQNGEKDVELEWLPIPMFISSARHSLRHGVLL